MAENVIEVENLVKYFDGRCVLDGIDLKVPRGCIYGLLGRNAAGKTTIIRILLGLEPATRGRASSWVPNQPDSHQRSRDESATWRRATTLSRTTG